MNWWRYPTVIGTIVAALALLLIILLMDWSCAPNAEHGPTLGSVFKLWGC